MRYTAFFSRLSRGTGDIRFNNPPCSRLDFHGHGHARREIDHFFFDLHPLVIGAKIKNAIRRPKQLLQVSHSQCRKQVLVAEQFWNRMCVASELYPWLPPSAEPADPIFLAAEHYLFAGSQQPDSENVVMVFVEIGSLRIELPSPSLINGRRFSGRRSSPASALRLSSCSRDDDIYAAFLAHQVSNEQQIEWENTRTVRFRTSSTQVARPEKHTDYRRFNVRRWPI
jgi:hypothetical protein